MATELVLEKFGKLNIKEGTNFPLNFNIQDLTRPESTPSSYSKDVTIIGDKEANKILGQAFDVNISDSSFDVNKKVGCNVIQDNATVFDGGFFQLLKVTKTGQSLPNGEPKIEYIGRVKSDLMSFFTGIKDRDLTDLNLGGFDTYQQLNRANILASFNNTVVEKWKYVPTFKVQNTNTFNINQWKPAIFAKTFWDEIHAQNGWQYEFDEIPDLKFDKLIIPYTSEFDADENYRELMEIIYQNGGFQQYDFGASVGYEDGQVNNDSMDESRLVIPTEIKDELNQYNSSTSNFKADLNSTYTFTYSFDYQHILTNGTNDNVSAFRENLFSGGEFLEYKYALWYQKYDASGNIIPSGNLFGLRFTQPKLVSKLEGKDPKFNYPSGTGYDLLPGTNIVSDGTLEIEFSEDMNQGDEIRNVQLVEFRSNETTPDEDIVWAKFTLDGIFDGKVGIGSFLNTSFTELKAIPELEYNIGTRIYIQQFIPRDIKQRDFIKSIIDMYKLVVDVDPTNDNKLIYKTRDKYYDEGRQVKWTKKLDTEKPINLEWLVDKQPKKMKFTYKQDDDIFNKAYFNHIKDVYGEFEYDFGNDYNIGTKENEIIFSPTPIQYSSAGNMYLPSLPLSDIEDLNIRILYDGGIRQGFWFLQNDDGTFPTSNESDYPYFGHLDDPVQPSFDINFGTCEFYFYNTWEFTTDNNLFNLYHRRYISQLTKGRIMTAYFKLTPKDILTLRLNDKIFINDSWWNINKVIDYNANSNSSTKVELVTVDDGVSVQPTRSIGVVNPNPTKPYVVSPYIESGHNEATSLNTISAGFVGVVYGTKNNISKDAKGVVIGDSNTMVGKSIIIGDGSSDGGFDGKMVVGDGIEASSAYDITANSIEAKEDIKIGNQVITENTITNIGTILYKARITQSGTNDPVVTEYINNTGLVISSIDRVQQGVYSINGYNGLLAPPQNLEITMSNGMQDGETVSFTVYDTGNSLLINTYDSSGVEKDGVLRAGGATTKSYCVLTITKY